MPNLPHAHISLVTLGVADVARAARFYTALGFERKMRAAGEEVAFFEAGGVALALWGMNDLARDAMLEPAARPDRFRAIALAWNCESPDEVDVVIEAAVSAGGRRQKQAQKVFWGGYAGYFADPDGHLWEVAHNPQFPLSADGRPALPD